MARHWKEPLRVGRHVDHFHPGRSRYRTERSGDGYACFVEVCGFTFELASIEQLRQTIAFFEMRIHPSSRFAVLDPPEKGEWQQWHERLPAKIRRGSRRERVLAALRAALEEFAPVHAHHGWRSTAKPATRP